MTSNAMTRWCTHELEIAWAVIGGKHYLLEPEGEAR